MDADQIRDVAALAVLCLFGLAGFTVWILKDFITDLKRQRDAQVEINKGTSQVFGRITERLDDIFDVVSGRNGRP